MNNKFKPNPMIKILNRINKFVTCKAPDNLPTKDILSIEYWISRWQDFSIKEYAKIILKTIIPDKKIMIKYDLTKPNGTPRKLLDVSLAHKYGWRAKIKLREAISLTYNSFLNKR